MIEFYWRLTLHFKSNLEINYFRDEPDEVTEIQSMPGINRYGINKLKNLLDPLIKKGLKSVLLFGAAKNLQKVRFCLE